LARFLASAASVSALYALSWAASTLVRVRARFRDRVRVRVKGLGLRVRVKVSTWAKT